uniref:Uncharacterized protein n=1 Tax=Cacopsylla melanoneura TaxID=428564 RepID=A0A8D8Q1Z6_9HEMI
MKEGSVRSAETTEIIETIGTTETIETTETIGIVDLLLGEISTVTDRLGPEMTETEAPLATTTVKTRERSDGTPTTIETLVIKPEEEMMVVIVPPLPTRLLQEQPPPLLTLRLLLAR